MFRLVPQNTYININTSDCISLIGAAYNYMSSDTTDCAKSKTISFKPIFTYE